MRKYTLIAQDKFSAYAFKEYDGFCEIRGFLDLLNATNQKDASVRSSMKLRIEYLVKGQLRIGPVHHDLGEGIRQITSGKYRLLYFFDEGKIVILTHWFEKKRNKTPPEQIKKAKKHREAYFEAKSNNILIFQGDNDD